jgi:late competence protein
MIGITIGILYRIYAYDIFKSFRALTVISVSLIIAGIDYREKIIPNEAVVFILSVSCIFILINVFTNTIEALAIFIDSAVAMLIGSGLFAISKAISKNGVGMGDIKLVGALGFYLRTYTLMGVLIVSLVSIALYGLFKVFTKKATTKDEIPFAPFIAFGVTACMLLGF